MIDITTLGLSEEQLQAVNTLKTDYETQISNLNTELSKLKPEEKTQAEKDLEARLQAIEDREKEVAAKERLQTIKGKLKEKGISEEFASVLLIGEDMDKDIENVANILNGMKLGSSYQPSNHGNNQGITKEQFKKMSYMERQKLFTTNPELYKALAKVD